MLLSAVSELLAQCFSSTQDELQLFHVAKECETLNA